MSLETRGSTLSYGEDPDSRSLSHLGLVYGIYHIPSPGEIESGSPGLHHMIAKKLLLPLTALIVSRDHKTSFLVHDLLKLVGLVKQS